MRTWVSSLYQNKLNLLALPHEHFPTFLKSPPDLLRRLPPATATSPSSHKRHKALEANAKITASETRLLPSTEGHPKLGRHLEEATTLHRETMLPSPKEPQQKHRKSVRQQRRCLDLASADPGLPAPPQCLRSLAIFPGRAQGDQRGSRDQRWLASTFTGGHRHFHTWKEPRKQTRRASLSTS